MKVALIVLLILGLDGTTQNIEGRLAQHTGTGPHSRIRSELFTSNHPLSLTTLIFLDIVKLYTPL